MSRTDLILQRLSGLHPKLIDLGLERIERLLEALGRPQDRLPPVIHVAGTNGKGSTIAFMRAFLEAAGHTVHVYTSPHLVRFNERIRLGGQLVPTRRLNEALERVERVNAGENITLFEVTTAAALLLFSETPADFLLLEVGMGGIYDTTNVVAQPRGVVITPVDLDHQAFLGNTIAEIAVSKAGILKRGSPAVIGYQQPEGRDVIERAARRLGVQPAFQGEDFHGHLEDGRLVFQDGDGLLDLPPPALVGDHQVDNASLAIAAVRRFGLPVDKQALERGLRTVSWPARMTPLTGKLRDALPPDAELWLDGGHNAHGAAALARALAVLQGQRPAPLVLIMGMMNNRSPAIFLEPLRQFNPKVLGLTIPGEANAHEASAIAQAAQALSLEATPQRSLGAAIRKAAGVPGGRVVICGSLYLAGHALALNGTPPH